MHTPCPPLFAVALSPTGYKKMPLESFKIVTRNCSLRCSSLSDHPAYYTIDRLKLQDNSFKSRENDTAIFYSVVKLMSLRALLSVA